MSGAFGRCHHPSYRAALWSRRTFEVVAITPAGFRADKWRGTGIPVLSSSVFTRRARSSFDGFHRNRRTEWTPVAKRDEKRAKEAGESDPVGLLERLNQCGLSLEKCGERVMCEVFAGGSEMNEDTAAVPGVGLAFDEPGSLEAIESDGHPPAGQKEILSQLGRRQGPDEIEFGKGFEITPMAEAVCGGDAVEPDLDQVGGPEHTGADFERSEVQFGAGGLPTVQHVVKTISRSFMLHLGEQCNRNFAILQVIFIGTLYPGATLRAGSLRQGIRSNCRKPNPQTSLYLS